MKHYKTSKLYYNTYLYRIEIYNEVAAWFREKKFHVTRDVLDRLQAQQDNELPFEIGLGRRFNPIKLESFVDAKRLYRLFVKTTSDYKLRVEKNYLNVYTNDKALIKSIKSTISPDVITSFYEPEKEYIHLLSKDTIVVDKYNGYQYKVTVGSKYGSPSFAMWAKNNPKLIKIGPTCLDEMKNGGYVSGMYFYARDEKTLQLIALMLDNVRRIDKLVVKQVIDK